MDIRIRYLIFDIRYSIESNIRSPNIRWFEYSSIRSNRMFDHTEYLNIRMNQIFGKPNIRLPDIRSNRIIEYSVEPNIRYTKYSVLRIFGWSEYSNIRFTKYSVVRIFEYIRILDTNIFECYPVWCVNFFRKLFWKQNWKNWKKIEKK